MTYGNRYVDALHGMQSGVKMTQELDIHSGVREDHRETGPKHLRTGVNSAMVDHGALAKLLVAKGIITEEEYVEAVTEMMEAERDKYQAELTERMGVPITLG